MKKYLTMGISIVLVIAAVIFAPIEQSDVKVGKGKGKDTEITTVKELGDVFYFIANLDFSEEASKGGGTTAVAYKTASSDDDDEIVTESKHTSVTFYNDSVVSRKYSLSSANESNGYEDRSYSMDMNRNLTIYMTKQAAYYKTKGDISYSTQYYKTVEESYKSVTQQRVTEAYYIVFDIEIYIDKDGALIKFNKFETLGDSGFQLADAAFGKWFSFSDEDFFEDILDIDIMNREQFGEIGEYIIENKASNYIANGDVYSLKEEFLLDTLEDIFNTYIPSDNKYTGEFTVDLSSPESPSVVIALDYSQSDYNKEIGNQSASSYSYNNIRFDNIDNTVIEGFADDAEIVVIDDPDDFVDAYIIETEG